MTQLWVWLIGTLASLILALVATKVKDDNRANGLLACLVSLVLTGMASLVVDGISDRRARAELMDRVVPTVRHPVWNAVVKDIAAYDARPRPQDGPWRFEDVLLERLRQPISKAVQQARDGVFGVDSVPEAVIVSIGLIDSATRSIRATSFITADDWWNTETGKAYEEAVKRAVTRGVRCERVYIVQDANELTSLAKLVKAQSAYGVEIKQVQATRLRPGLSGDFIVIDGLSAGELSLDSQRRFKSATFHVTKVIADDYERRFQELWVQSGSIK